MFIPIRALRDKIHLRTCGLFLLAGFFVVGLATGPVQTASAQNTYVVNSSGDADDDNPGDGVCETGGGDCTLRAAIQEANETSDNDDIEFDIPQTGSFAVITPSEEFTITEPVTIDGTTSPEYPSSVDGPAIELDGSSLSSSADDGIEVKASDVTIHGLAINRFPDEGIDVFSGNDNVDIQDCFVGIAPDDGSSDRGNLTNSDGNQDAGIDLEGDDFTLQDNVISHNNGDGVRIAGSSTSSGVAYAQENLIGLDHDGDAAAGNSGAGVRIDSGSEVAVGLVTPNIISANSEAGIVEESGGNTIINNYVGTDLNGTTSTGSDGNSLGNGEDGIEVFADGTDIDNNLISGNSTDGIQIGEGGGPADNTTITNNDIGVNADVNATLQNGDDGIDIIEASGTTIDRNVIGGNGSTGIEVNAVNANVSERTVITGNYIGTNNNGDDLGNEYDGLEIAAAPSQSSLEIEIFDGNVIGHNQDHGIEFIAAENHDVAGNYIGTNPDGDDLGNESNGILINDGGDLDIYPAINEGTEEEGNVIGFNDMNGIYIFEADNTEIEENYIGTNPNGDDLGNASDGLGISASSGNSADGTVVGYGVGESVPDDPSPSNGENGNVFANNGANGVIVEGDGNPVDNSIRGNSVFGNANQGIVLDGTDGDDNGDGDTGPNHGQNYPVIDDVTNCDDSSTPTTVDVTYKVRSNDGGGDESQYPLQVDFYVADSESGSEGKTFIQSEEYGSSDALSSVGTVLETEDATCDDFFVATATDDRGNTSEFFAPSQQLPVELAAFEGTQTGEDAVELSWTTASEQNNAGFEVQRRDATEAETDEATAEGDWEKVGYVESKADGGTTNEAITYRFTTEDLKVGTHAFRLKQVDLDGTENLHDPTVIELQMKEALRLDAPAPNPVRGQATLSFAVKEQAETTISLYNTLGQKVSTVYRGTPSAGEQQTVDLSATDLSSGVYFLRLEAGGQTRTERMTVVR